jgi:hypothetical protein
MHLEVAEQSMVAESSVPTSENDLPPGLEAPVDDSKRQVACDEPTGEKEHLENSDQSVVCEEGSLTDSEANVIDTETHVCMEHLVVSEQSMDAESSVLISENDLPPSLEAPVNDSNRQVARDETTVGEEHLQIPDPSVVSELAMPLSEEDLPTSSAATAVDSESLVVCDESTVGEEYLQVPELPVVSESDVPLSEEDLPTESEVATMTDPESHVVCDGPTKEEECLQNPEQSILPKDSTAPFIDSETHGEEDTTTEIKAVVILAEPDTTMEAVPMRQITRRRSATPHKVQPSPITTRSDSRKTIGRSKKQTDE